MDGNHQLRVFPHVIIRLISKLRFNIIDEAATLISNYNDDLPRPGTKGQRRHTHREIFHRDWGVFQSIMIEQFGWSNEISDQFLELYWWLTTRLQSEVNRIINVDRERRSRRPLDMTIGAGGGMCASCGAVRVEPMDLSRLTNYRPG